MARLVALFASHATNLAFGVVSLQRFKFENTWTKRCVVYVTF